MKTPPFLLGATLLFWGWQSGFLLAAVPMALILESPRWIEARWEFSNDDFWRIWTFCTILLLAATVFAFTANEGPANFHGFFSNPNLRTERNVGTTMARSVAAVIRWLPMMFFFFMAAQSFSAREGVPLETISFILQWRWKKARKLGQPLPPSRSVNISYPFFGLCLMAASAHSGDDNSYFWGLCLLLAWALWPHRSRNLAVWAAAVGVAITTGYFGQGGLSKLQRYLETINPQWFSGFTRQRFEGVQTKTGLGQIGRLQLSPTIVIRLDPGTNSPPNLLREASYHNYARETWSVGTAHEDFATVLQGTNETSYILLPDKTNTLSLNIACYLPGGQGLLPLPGGSGRLDNLMVLGVERNSGGAVLAKGPGLAIFDAEYGPGPMLDSAPEKEDTLVSPREPRELAALDKVAEELQLDGKTTHEKLRAVSQFFQSKFSYSLWQERDAQGSTNETPLSRFLLRTRKGHCEFFATATTLLLRRADIPTRYAVGYAVHEMSGSKYVVRQRDAHAWCLVWNDDKHVWDDFDTTPSSSMEAEGGDSAWQKVSDAWSRVVFEFSKVRWGQTNLRQYILWVLLPVLALLLYQIMFRSRRKRRHRGFIPLDVLWPGLDSEFYQLERKLIARGVPREPGEPLSVWLHRAAADPTLADFKARLQHLLSLHYRYRFDPVGITRPDRERLRQEATSCLTGLSL
jgi:hypothetical protein